MEVPQLSDFFKLLGVVLPLFLNPLLRLILLVSARRLTILPRSSQGFGGEDVANLVLQLDVSQEHGGNVQGAHLVGSQLLHRSLRQLLKHFLGVFFLS